MTPIDHFQAGDLEQALSAATEAVRNAPSDVNARSLFCELLCFAGDLERADKQLDALGDVSPDTAVGVSQFRHLIRAETARREFYVEGRLPECVEQPTDEIQKRLHASVCLREGNRAEAAQALAEAETLRQAVSGRCDGDSFDDLRDLDDLLSGVLEILTSNGKYYWLPFSAVQSISFESVSNLRDMLWRPARIEMGGELDGQVHIPALYFGSHENEDQRIRIGRATDWKQDDAGPVLGTGQRMLLIGEDDHPVMQIGEIEVS